MPYQALYRKYRPHRFADVVGQEHITKTLQNALREGQVAHAYLFSGPRGTGKTTVARILAAAVNCYDLRDGEPCGQCDSCRSIAKGAWGLIEIDGASNNSVEDIRDLQARIHNVPIHAQRQVYIIDEVHQLSSSAFNAFLKTLEEPPEHAMFILATTEPGKLLPTVMSRCQHYPFRRIPARKISAELHKILDTEAIPYEPEAVELISRLADGALRDAESILDQLIAFDREKVTLENCRKVLGTVDEDLLFALAHALLEADSAGILSVAESFAAAGRDYPLVLKDLTGLFRDSLIASLDDEALAAEGHSEAYIKRAKELRSELPIEVMSQIIANLARKSSEMRYELEKRILFETALIDIAQRLAKFKVAKTTTPTTPTTPTPSTPPQPEPKPKASAMATAPQKTPLPPKPQATEMSFPGGGDDLEPVEPPPVTSYTPPPPAASFAPPPQPVPPRSTPQFEGPVDISDPIASWDKFLWMISKASVAKAVLLSQGTPISFTEDILKVEFQPDKALIGSALIDPFIKDELERIVSDLFERPIALEMELKQQREKGSQSGLFEGEIDPDVSELKGIIENEVLKKVTSARIKRIEKTE